MMMKVSARLSFLELTILLIDQIKAAVRNFLGLNIIQNNIWASTLPASVQNDLLALARFKAVSL